MTENNNYQTHIDALTGRVANLSENDFDEAVSIVRDAIVVARRIFGEESAHLEELCNISFRPRGIIANTGHYLNRDAWAAGVKQLGRTLDSIKYEYKIIQQNPKELEAPSTVTLLWLFHHLSLSIWLTFASILLATFLTGFAVAKNNLLGTLLNDIRDALSHSRPTPKEKPTAPPTTLQNNTTKESPIKNDTTAKP